MDEAQALSIVSALANGVNPQTGEIFPPESPYQSADIVRALFAACRALDAQRLSSPRSRDNMPPNAGKPWKEQDDRRLLEDFDRGSSISELSKALGRTSAGIHARLEKHGRGQPQASNGQSSADRHSWRRARPRAEN